MELTLYGIEYAPRPSIKTQALADFIVECSAYPVEGSLVEGPKTAELWEIHTDGAGGSKHCMGGVMVTTPEGFRLYYVLREERLVLYKDVAEGLLDKLEAYEITHILRAENTEADILSKLASGSTPSHLSMARRTEVIERPSTEVLSVCTVLRVSSPPPDKTTSSDWPWFADMVRYKEKAELLNKKEDADHIRRRASSYKLVDGLLYKRSFGGRLLCCLPPEEARTVMAANHRGICAAHQGANTLARKLVIQGYYWPTMIKDYVEEVLRCPVCQMFARKGTRPVTFYTPITTAIPFAKWGIDLLGRLL
ncbi:PREDICTED: uncharacterized protein LOC109168166 [Ipomoea nil]|uniref:uncharacterized protein LOC109168166 n=1 Tax=Ipomoea nil TaxID=35883 RepID=UPI000900C9A3|nr:PREDICTED: uncharacterized protein LOC109168166 [Ipomoea nil]